MQIRFIMEQKHLLLPILFILFIFFSPTLMNCEEEKVAQASYLNNPTNWSKILIFMDGELLIKDPIRAKNLFQSIWEEKVDAVLNNIKFKNGDNIPPVEIKIVPLCDLTNQTELLLDIKFGQHEADLLRDYRNGPERIKQEKSRILSKKLREFSKDFVSQNGTGPSRKRITKIMDSGDVLTKFLQTCEEEDDFHVIYISDMIEWDHTNYSFKEEGIDFVNYVDVNRAKADLLDTSKDLYAKIQRMKKQLGSNYLPINKRKIEVLSPKITLLYENEGVGRASIEEFWEMYFSEIGFTVQFL